MISNHKNHVRYFEKRSVLCPSFVTNGAINDRTKDGGEEFSTEMQFDNRILIESLKSYCRYKYSHSLAFISCF